MDDERAPHAVVPLVGRGDLVLEPLHGAPLFTSAVAALAGVVDRPVIVAEPERVEQVGVLVEGAGLEAVVTTAPAWWSVVRRGARAVLVHDPLCPLTPPDFLATLAARDGSAAAMRPVTDTVKTADAGRITGTIDRETLAALVSPVLLSAEVVAAAALDDQPPPLDVTALVGWLRERGLVELVTAPAMARRVEDLGSLSLLECVDELARQLRQERGRVGGPVSGGPVPRPHAPA